MSKSTISLVPSDRFYVTDPEEAVKLQNESQKPRSPLTVVQMLNEAVEEVPTQIAFKWKRNEEEHSMTYAEYRENVWRAGKALIKCGLEEGHSVCVIGFNSPEWFVAYLGAIHAGGMGAGVYPTNSPEACHYVLSHSRCNIVVVEDDLQLQKILAIRDKLPDLKAIVQYIGTPTLEDVYSWKDFMALGEGSNLDETLELSMSKVAANKCCCLVYTSGTTGNPKGVMLSHDNITFTSRLIGETIGLIEREEVVMSYMPPSHIAALLLDMVVMISFRSTTVFADKNALKGTLVESLKFALPTVFFGVPRVWEKIQEKLTDAGKANSGFKRLIGDWAKRTVYDFNKNFIVDPDYPKSLQFKIADAVVLQKVKKALGLERCRNYVSAGAPAALETLNYFMSLDIIIYELYGMSECTGPHSCNANQHVKLGTVGRTLDGLMSKINDEGEICMKGRHIMMGYLFDPENTKNAFTEDGYLMTGDLGKIDSDGYVSITGRIKELIITAGGENIPHLLIEEKIKALLPGLNNVMVIGDKRKFLSCFLTLKTTEDPNTSEPLDDLAPDAIQWCESLGSESKTLKDIIDSPDEKLFASIQRGINEYNSSAMSNAQKIQKWKILPKDFSMSGGELGPTLKIKRSFALKKYSAYVDQFYS